MNLLNRDIAGTYKTEKPQILKKDSVYACKWFEIFKSKVKYSNSNIIPEQHIIEFPNDSVAAILMNKKNEILFVYPYRFLYDEPKPEIPAGYIDKGETAYEAIIREVHEETGYSVVDGRFLTAYEPNNSLSAQKYYIYFFNIEENELCNFDKMEIQKLQWIQKEKIIDMIKKNQISDGLTLTGLLYFFWLEKENPY